MANDKQQRPKDVMKEKTAKLQEVNARVQQFVAKGGDLKSKEAVPLGMELIHAFDELAQEFGHKIIVPMDEEKGKG